jgi:hypothetical protein
MKKLISNRHPNTAIRNKPVTRKERILQYNEVLDFVNLLISRNNEHYSLMQNIYF